MLLLPYQCSSERIHERSVRRVCNQDADAVSMDRAVHVEFSVPFHNLLRPCTVIVPVPFEILERCNGSTVLPVHHVCSGVEEPVPHDEVFTVVVVVACVKVEGVADDDRCRVCRVLCLDDRHVQVFQRLLWRAVVARYDSQQSQRRQNGSSFHVVIGLIVCGLFCKKFLDDGGNHAAVSKSGKTLCSDSHHLAHV